MARFAQKVSEPCPRCEAECKDCKVRCAECGQILDSDTGYEQRHRYTVPPAVMTPDRINVQRGAVA